MTRKVHSIDLILVVCVFSLCLWMGLTARGFSPLAAVFPIFLAVTCGTLALLLGVVAFAGKLQPPPVPSGSIMRRVLVAGALVVWVALIEPLGFIVASIGGFIAVGLAAKYESWKPREWLRFCLIALIFVVGLSLLFIHGLNVPLAQGSLLGG